eukprot:1153197-Pyramimonas_sp.AAC.1
MQKLATRQIATHGQNRHSLTVSCPNPRASLHWSPRTRIGAAAVGEGTSEASAGSDDVDEGHDKGEDEMQNGNEDEQEEE